MRPESQSGLEPGPVLDRGEFGSLFEYLHPDKRQIPETVFQTGAERHPLAAAAGPGDRRRAFAQNGRKEGREPIDQVYPG